MDRPIVTEIDGTTYLVVVTGSYLDTYLTALLVPADRALRPAPLGPNA